MTFRSLAKPEAPDDLGAWAERHFEWMLTRNYSEATVLSRRPWLRTFIAWCDQRSLRSPGDVTKATLEGYQQHLFAHRKTDGRPLGAGTQRTRLTALKSYFRWLSRQGIIAHNPAADLDLPRREARLPRAVLTAHDADRVLSLPTLDTPIGLRDRAILETFYSSGLRRTELIRLGIYDIDHQRGTVLVRMGKGKRDRLVPIGERALSWIDRYIREARPRLVAAPDEGFLFLTAEGSPLDPDMLSSDVGRFVRHANLGKKGACHLFRHTMATLLLEGGADVRYVQEMLGHASLESTQIYTHVAIGKLKEIHTAAHPGARLKPTDAAPATAARTSGDTRDG